MDRVETNPGELLNAAQQNHFLVSLKYADQLLGDCEHILASGSSQSLFPKYQNDLSLEDRERIERFIEGLRALLVQVLSRLSIPTPSPQFRASHGVATNLDFIEMNFDELRPNNDRGRANPRSMF